MKRFSVPKYRIPINGQWQLIYNTKLHELEKTDPDIYDAYDTAISEYQKNPLSFSLMHGSPNNGPFKNDGLACVNDYEHDLILLTAPNQVGKTTCGAVYNLMRLIPTDPSWPCYQKHDFIYKEWEGPRILIISSYSWDKTRDLWETYRAMIPREEIGGYAPYWGHFEGERGLAKNFTFRYEAKEMKLKCGSKIITLCYQQSLAQWTGKQADLVHLDEQCPETHFDEVTARQLTRGPFTPIIMTLTGHIIKGRPDTGAAGWIKQKIVDQGVTKGRKVAQYKMDIPNTPDAIFSAESKEKARIQWVEEPLKYKNEAKTREAEARYWGGWEVGGGIVLSEWNPVFHWIEPFDLKHWNPTYYRMIDHGQNPCACALLAIMPWGDAVVFAEHYEFGLNIESNVEKILDMCGNSRRQIDCFEHRGMTWPVYEEISKGTFFRSSELDGRSFAQRANESGRTLGSLYNQFGCRVSPACGDFDDTTIPLLKEWLAISKDRQHIYKRLGRKIDVSIEGMGAPKLYIFNTCTNLKKEIEGYIDKKCPVHLVDCIKYVAARDRPYCGDYFEENIEHTEQSADTEQCDETGY